VYQYTDLKDTTGRNGLWKISPDDNSAERIVEGIAEHAQWSPDGRFIVFDADTGQSIKMIPAEGGNSIMFLPDTIHIKKGGLPCWSPDASQIAFKDQEYFLCIYNVKSGKTTRIFNPEGMLLLPGCWSHDGKYVLIALKDRQSNKSTIWKISTDGNERIQITGHHEAFYRYLALSPDGQLLVYAAKEGKYLGLYIMPAEGGNSLPLAVSPRGLNESASWSHDGQKIAFTSTRSGYYDIWIMDVNIEHIKEELQKL
jgi:Tol biopolymer transport system component